MKELHELETEIERLRECVRGLVRRLETQFFGQTETIDRLVLSLLAGGHVLLEGAPGLGKTTLVHALSRAVDLDFQRLQCTPDLMPSDVLGSRVLRIDSDSGTRAFDFEPGPVFTNVLLADEVNRATPRTQSALLEAMQEKQVTLHGTTHKLAPPFFVVATQNPIEMEGTYPLPEAQLDRFLFKLELGLPSATDIARILSATTGAQSSDEGPCLARKDLLRLQELTRQVSAPADLVQSIAALVLATHPSHESATGPVKSYIRHGASLRGGQAILLTAKARALLRGVLHVEPADVRAVATPALRHRLIPSFEGEAAGFDMDELLTGEVLDRVLS